MTERTGRAIRLEVDGGVKIDNIGAIAQAGADTFVAGSAIFGSGDYAKTISCAARSGEWRADRGTPPRLGVAQVTIAATPRIRVRAIAFDLDGTLLDTIHDLATAINMMLARLGQPSAAQGHRARDGRQGHGEPGAARAGRDAGDRCPSPADEARALAMYEADYERILGRETVVFPGVREGLERLASAGFGLACVTNKTSRFVRPHLEQAGLASYFSLVVGGDSLAEKKPDPLPLQHAARHFCVAPGRLLMLGDSANDTQAARAAGARSFACLTATTKDGPCKASIAMV